MYNFVKVKRGGDEAVSGGPLVSVRAKQLAFNADFSKLAELDKNRYVVFYTDDAQRILKMRFSADPDDPDSYTVVKDGGGATSGKCVQAGNVLAKPWIASVAKQAKASRRFVPKKAEGKDSWIISLMPAFEEIASSPADIPTSAVGIYRYVKDPEEIVYIGRGAIRGRAKEPARKQWVFDRIEYSIVEDPAAQEEWERFWIDRFQDETGSLPVYNKIKGTTTSKHGG